MPATCTVFNACPEEDIPILRELLSLEMLCEQSTTFVRNELGQLMFYVPPSPLHWSRQGEWPWVLRHADLSGDHRVLDAGSGWSILKFALARRCLRVVALEVNPEFMAKAQKTIDAMDLGAWITQVQGDVRKIPFPDNWFDRTVCVSVVEHIDGGSLDAVQELVRVTKPGGKLLLTMDVRISHGSVDYGDFYLDADGARKIFEFLECPLPKVDGRVIGSKQLDDRVEIVVLMIEYVKPE